MQLRKHRGAFGDKPRASGARNGASGLRLNADLSEVTATYFLSRPLAAVDHLTLPTIGLAVIEARIQMVNNRAFGDSTD